MHQDTPVTKNILLALLQYRHTQARGNQGVRSHAKLSNPTLVSFNNESIVFVINIILSVCVYKSTAQQRLHTLYLFYLEYNGFSNTVVTM